MNIQDWFPLELTGLIFLLSKGLSRVFSNTTVQKHLIFSSLPYGPTLTSSMTTGKTIALTRRTFVVKVMSLLFNMLSTTTTTKSLQSCLTLYDPIDGSPPGSPILGIKCWAWGSYVKIWRQNPLEIGQSGSHVVRCDRIRCWAISPGGRWSLKG